MLIDERHCLIAGPLLQPSGFSCPYVTVGAQNRSFQKQWLNEFTWLAYSNIYNGAFGKWCIVFAPQTVSCSGKPSGSLVSGPHCQWRTQKIFMGGSFSGIWWSLYLVCGLCDVTVLRHIHVSKPTFWRSLLT